jgi:hypothetical protein
MVLPPLRHARRAAGMGLPYIDNIVAAAAVARDATPTWSRCAARCGTLGFDGGDKVRREMRRKALDDVASLTISHSRRASICNRLR